MENHEEQRSSQNFINLVAVLTALFTIGLTAYSVYLLFDNWQLQQQVKSSETQSMQLQNTINDLRSANLQLQNAFASGDSEDEPTNPSTDTCKSANVNLGISLITIPCTWHGYFKNIPTQQDSTGYISPRPLIEYPGAIPRAGQVRIIVSRYATSLSNYVSDPMQAVITYWGNQDKTLTQQTNNNGVVFYYLKVNDTQEGELEYYYAQREYNGDNYLVTLNNQIDTDNSITAIVDSFKWL